eukprot:683776-Prymnesium_polylepis.1
MASLPESGQGLRLYERYSSVCFPSGPGCTRGVWGAYSCAGDSRLTNEVVDKHVRKVYAGVCQRAERKNTHPISHSCKLLAHKAVYKVHGPAEGESAGRGFGQ